eukprot:tig00001388_g8584.t1
MAASKTGVPSLLELCIQYVAKRLQYVETLEGIPDELQARIFSCRSQTITDDTITLYLSFSLGAGAGVAASASASSQEALLGGVDVLSLRGAAISDAACRTIAERLPHLRHLDLGLCERISPKGLEEVVAASAESLRALILTATKANDETLGAIAARCRGLERLDVDLCPGVSDVGVQSVARRLGGTLRSLSLGGCKKVSNVSMQIIGEHMGGRIESLDVGGLDGIMDMDVADLTKRAFRLRRLCLRACWRVTDACLKSVAALVRGQAKRGEGYGPLTSLDLGGCKRVTDAGLGQLAGCGAALEELDLRGLPLVSPAGLAGLAAGLPRLRHVCLAKSAVTPEQAAELTRRHPAVRFATEDLARPASARPASRR